MKLVIRYIRVIFMINFYAHFYNVTSLGVVPFTEE